MLWTAAVCVWMAEREGFEPSVPRKEDNGFRDRPVRPLRHLSVLSYMGRACRRCDPGRARTLAEASPPRNRGPTTLAASADQPHSSRFLCMVRATLTPRTLPED